MQVQDIQFEQRHAIHNAIQSGHGEEVARHIQREAPPGKPRCILHHGDVVQGLQEACLIECRHTMQGAPGGRRAQTPPAFETFQAVAFIAAQLRRRRVLRGDLYAQFTKGHFQRYQQLVNTRRNPRVTRAFPEHAQGLRSGLCCPVRYVCG